MHRCLSFLTVTLVVWATILTVAEAEQPSIHFGRDIRPVLSENCFRCHGPDQQTREAGLRLDLESAAIDSGVIIPQAPQDSELVARIMSADPDMVMPPPSTGKSLTSEQKQVLRRWVAQGASYSRHWAFTAPKRPSVPRSDTSWCRNPIDHFVEARHHNKQLSATPQANPATLVRRLYLDLVGLPPSPDQLDRFLESFRSDGEQGYRRQVDELLTSQHFGEKWAQWWLDAARYADSDGYEKDKQRSVWFYRDWVIRAMNRDLPYDEFIIRQVAGDLLPNATQADLVATGFLRNSMVNEEGGADPEEFRVAGIFDRIDAIGKSVLGITTKCAQCHDHKFDPLSQREYYQMFAALNDCHEAMATVYTDKQGQRVAEITENTAQWEQRLKQRMPDWRDRVDQWAEQVVAVADAWKTLTPTQLPYEGQKFRVLPDGSIISESYAPTRANNTFQLEIDPCTIAAIRLDTLTHPQLPRGGPGRSILGSGALSEFEVAVTPADGSGQPQKLTLSRAESDIEPPRSKLLPFYRQKDAANDDRVTGPIQYAIDGKPGTAWTTDIGPAHRNEDHCATFLLDQPIQVTERSIISFTLRQLHGGWNSDDNQNYLLGRYRFSLSGVEPPSGLGTTPHQIVRLARIPAGQRTEKDYDKLFSYWRRVADECADLNQEIVACERHWPEGESQLVVRAMKRPRPTHVMLRGDFLSKGDQVHPGTPEFLHPSRSTQKPARLRFARWLVDRQSPTTARVVVNRIWQAYFGQALVTTPEDFGHQSAEPSHPQLLDWLAVELMENNWSLKHIHRLVVNSATYRQSSRASDEAWARDPDNRWLARGPRFRVNAELVRDIALAASGLLNRTIGGPSAYPPAPDFLFQPPASYGPKNWYESQDGDQYRRSLYVHKYRSVPYPPLKVYDAPKGDTACVRRPRSNTPLQALVALNEPQFVQCAQSMAHRVVNEGGDRDRSRLEYAFRLAVGRRPQAWERKELSEFLATQRTRLENQQLNVDQLIGNWPKASQAAARQNASELVPWMTVCRVLLNLDETITKN